MRRLIESIVVATLLSFAVPAAAAQEEVTLDTVIERLAAPSVVRGNFEQHRHIPILEKPLVSNGDFILSERGLFWRQLSQPVAIVIADGERMVQKIGDREPEVSDENSIPMVLPFSRIFLGIFRGDEAQLREHFAIEFSVADGRWTMTLTPVTEPMSLAIAAIVLGGQDHIEELAVLGHSGDRSDIRFGDIRTEPDCLEDYEIELYAP